MPNLFDPLTLRDLTLRNRIGVSPMCQYVATDGLADDWHLVHLGGRATGGAGLVMTEATAVSAVGRITHGDLGLWSDRHADALRPIVEFVRAQGAALGVQLAHAGRRGSSRRPWEGGTALGNTDIDAGEQPWQTVSASTLALSPEHPAPRTLSVDEIQGIVADFAAAARRADEIGVDLIEIHAGYGYLLHGFLSPITNTRTDLYGGSFENRIRFLLEVVAAVRDVWPARKPLTVRLPARDWLDGGWTIDDAIAVSALLKNAGVDLIDVVAGGIASGEHPPVGPGYLAPYAARIRDGSGIPTAVSGFITDPAQADTIISDQDADVIMLARAMLRDSNWPHTAAIALERAASVPWPQPYHRAA